MKAFKKIAAIGAAMMMAFSMMSIGASASDSYESFNLRYRDDETNNVIVQEIGTIYSVTYYVHVAGQLSEDNFIFGVYGNHRSEGQVWYSSSGEWKTVVTQDFDTNASQGSHIKTKSSSYAIYNKPARARQTLRNLSQTSAANASGLVYVY